MVTTVSGIQVHSSTKCVSSFPFPLPPPLEKTRMYFIVLLLSSSFIILVLSILYKSTTGRYRPVRVADGPITARYGFIKNASWGMSSICLKKKSNNNNKNKTKQTKKKQIEGNKSRMEVNKEISK